VLSLFILKERSREKATGENINFFSFLKFWRRSPNSYRKLVIGLLAFALINSSDVFLLLKIKESGFSDTYVIGIYIFYNLVFALFALPIGILADRIGLKKIFISGIFVFALVYIGMGLVQSLPVFIFLFLLYGLYAAAKEGIAKAWITNIALPENTATAIGTYTGLQSICALIASSLAGFFWYSYGDTFLFIFSGSGAILVSIYLLIITR
jgi:MFS family permease